MAETSTAVTPAIVNADVVGNSVRLMRLLHAVDLWPQGKDIACINACQPSRKAQKPRARRYCPRRYLRLPPGACDFG
jgi:hypothetical protein